MALWLGHPSHLPQKEAKVVEAAEEGSPFPPLLEGPSSLPTPRPPEPEGCCYWPPHQGAGGHRAWAGALEGGASAGKPSGH